MKETTNFAASILAASFVAVTGHYAHADNTPAGENVTEARPVLARPALRGGLSFGGAGLYIAAYGPGWGGIPVTTPPSSSGEGPRPFEIRGAQTYFKGTSEWALQADNTIRGRVEVECVTPVEMQCVALAVDIPSPPPVGLGDASAATFNLPLADGRTARLSFPQPVSYHSQDSRQWGGNWTVRFAGHLGHGGTRTFEKGERLVWEMTLATPDGLAIAESKPLDIVANDDWVRLDYRKDIVRGSALDLSGQGLQDAPAGKHGWLKAVGGHFEFEKLPGVEQRFYGVNLCFSANYPDHEVADRIVDRFVRLGYNTIRVHHHDGAWAKAYARREVANLVPEGQLNAAEGGDLKARSANLSGEAALKSVDVVNDDIDRLDYLLAKCFEHGIYVTTDLYVSRTVLWRDVGIDRDGDMDKQLFKTYVGLHDGAYSNWCHWARAFLEHVNPYTGRAYKDEPGLPLISLINEGKYGMGWGGSGKGRDPVVQAAWRQCRMEMQNAECRMQNDAGDTPPLPGANARDSADALFDNWINRRIWERGTAFVRALGCRALLTNDNNGRWHGEGEGLTPLYDYVDNHFYVDHPQFLEQSWRLPSKCGNANPIKAELPSLLHRGYAKNASKPYAITEWNFSGPGRYRGMGGILTGAMAAEQEWDGLWRFAYSHSNGNLVDGKGYPGYFDCVTDPLIAASDRASVCLYLRGDAAQIQTNAQCTMHNAQFGKALRLDKQRGSMTLVSPRTCGGFAESGRINAGPLSFEIIERQNSNVESLATTNHSSLVTRHSSLRGGHAVPTTLWASSLDGEPLERSSRILLTHLTDVQGDGARYADDQRKILLKWGKTPLIEVGAALVELRFDEREGRTGNAGNAGNDDALRANDDAADAANDGALRANDDGAPRQMTNDKSNVIAPQAHVIATEGGSSLPQSGSVIAPQAHVIAAEGGSSLPQSGSVIAPQAHVIAAEGGSSSRSIPQAIASPKFPRSWKTACSASASAPQVPRTAASTTKSYARQASPAPRRSRLSSVPGSPCKTSRSCRAWPFPDGPSKVPPAASTPTPTAGASSAFASPKTTPPRSKVRRNLRRLAEKTAAPPSPPSGASPPLAKPTCLRHTSGAIFLAPSSAAARRLSTARRSPSSSTVPSRTCSEALSPTWCSSRSMVKSSCAPFLTSPLVFSSKTGRIGAPTISRSASSSPKARLRPAANTPSTAPSASGIRTSSSPPTAASPSRPVPTGFRSRTSRGSSRVPRSTSHRFCRTMRRPASSAASSPWTTTSSSKSFPAYRSASTASTSAATPACPPRPRRQTASPPTSPA